MSNKTIGLLIVAGVVGWYLWNKSQTQAQTAATTNAAINSGTAFLQGLTATQLQALSGI